MDNNYINTSIETNTTEKKSLKNKKLIIITGLFGAIVLIAIASLFVMSSKKPSKTTSNSEIKLKTEYQNPFDRSTRYTNPFENLK